MSATNHTFDTLKAFAVGVVSTQGEPVITLFLDYDSAKASFDKIVALAKEDAKQTSVSPIEVATVEEVQVEGLADIESFNPKVHTIEPIGMDAYDMIEAHEIVA